MQQQRLLSAWDEVVGKPIAQYTGERFIKNQTLFVKVLSPALRADLTMGRSLLVKRLNEKAGDKSSSTLSSTSNSFNFFACKSLVSCHFIHQNVVVSNGISWSF